MTYTTKSYVLLSAIAVGVFLSRPAGGTILIDFDDQAAPPVFASQVPLAEEYAALGVHFSGTGAVLHNAGNFSVPLSILFLRQIF